MDRGSRDPLRGLESDPACSILKGPLGAFSF